MKDMKVELEHYLGLLVFCPVDLGIKIFFKGIFANPANILPNYHITSKRFVV